MSEKNILMQQLQENGSYDQLYPKTVLTNETSQMFGMDKGTPEQILKYLGKYNQYWWEKRSWKRVKQKRETNKGVMVSYQIDYIYYSEDVSYQQYSGNYYAQLKNSKKWDNIYHDADIFNNNYQQYISGKYIQIESGISAPVYYIPKVATVTATAVSKKLTLTASSYEIITYSYVSSSLIGYVQSNSRNTYPDEGNQGDYYYTFLGIPLSNAVLLAKTEEHL